LEIDSLDGFPRIKGEIVTQEKRKIEPRLKITLFQSIPKGDKIGLIVQKCTEIGVSEIFPIISERTIVRLDSEKAKEKVLRWQKIAKEAAKQSGRDWIPKVGPILDFSQALKEFSKRRPQIGIIAWEMEEKNGLKKVFRSRLTGRPSDLRLSIFIGPEGGFGPEEVEKAKKAGLVPVSLGSRILRTETAGLVVAAAALYESSDLSSEREM